MKKLTKIIFSCAAVAALTAALGTAALADEEAPTLKATVKGTPTLTVDAESILTGTISLTAVDTGAEQTILVFTTDNADAPTVADEDIEYINQKSEQFTSAPLMKAVAEGTYVIRVGGSNGGYKEAIIEVKADNGGGGGDDTDPNAPQDPTRKLGDVKKNDKIQVNDAAAIATYAAGLGEELTGDDLLAADANLNGKVQVNDAAMVAADAAGLTAASSGKTLADRKVDGEWKGVTPR